EGWAASAIVALAGYFLTLVRSRLPAAGGGVVADLMRMRAYAEAELLRARPQLDDRWIARLRALGLGPAIEAWRARAATGGGSPHRRHLVGGLGALGESNGRARVGERHEGAPVVADRHVLVAVAVDHPDARRRPRRCGLIGARHAGNRDRRVEEPRPRVQQVP